MMVPNTASATIPMPASWRAESPPLELDGSVTGGAVVSDEVVVLLVVLAALPSPLASAPAGSASAAQAAATTVAARTPEFRRFIAPNISAAGP